jgi:hypothetical protein
MGRKLLKPGTKISPDELCLYVQDLRSETQTAMGKVKDKLTRPDMLREEAYVRVIFGLHPTPRPALPWAERQADLVWDGQVLAQARAEAMARTEAEVLAMAWVDAGIKGRRESQALARDREEAATRRPGEFPSWLSRRQEDRPDAFDDKWALTHEPVGPGLSTPDQIREMAVQAGVECSLNDHGDRPWDLPRMVEAENVAFRDPNREQAELTARTKAKLQERDQAYYEQPWPVRQPELVQDGWRRVLANLHDAWHQAEERIRQAPVVRNLIDRIESFRRPLLERRQAAQDAARAARGAQRAAGIKDAPPKTPRDKGGGMSH